jgi:DHA2 family multidrug resistance protein
MADLKGPEIGQGSGLNNMMRQLGGSFGIATLTTLIHIRQGVHRNNLLVNITRTIMLLPTVCIMLMQGFMAKGKSILMLPYGLPGH